MAAELARVAEQDWSKLVDEAVRHGVAPLLYHRLQSLHRWVTPPAEAFERLRDIQAHNALRNATVFRELAEVLAALRGAGVDVIALKGAHLAARVYGSAALRPMVDVDLLVRMPDLERAAAQLRDLGYTHAAEVAPGIDYATFHHLRPFEKVGAIPVELHRTVVMSNSHFRLDLDGLWQRAREAEVAGVDVLVLSPEDLLLHLCTHASHTHGFDIPLLSICDIAAVLEHYEREIDWQRLASIANCDGRARFVHLTLSLASRMLGARAVLPPALDGVRHDDADREILDVVRDIITTAPVDLPAPYRHLHERRGLGRKLLLVAANVFPGPARLRSIYRVPPRSRAVYRYYLTRPLDLLVRRGKTAFEVAVRSRRVLPTLERQEKLRRVGRWVEETSRAVAARL